MPKYNGFATNMEAMRVYNFCARTQPNNILGCCLGDVQQSSPIPIPDPGKMKTVFLLELTAGAVQPTDTTFKNTLNYYWNTYPQEFTRCPIVDTQGSLEKNLELLETYYNKGYRYFGGFTSSNILTGVLNWFNFHSDAIGMTIFGVSSTLTIPKNIYRFLPNNTYRIKYIPNLTTAPNVYYIYQSGLLVGDDIKNLLINIPISSLYVLSANSSDLTVSNINTFLSASSSNDDILITLLSSIRSEYINLYSEGLNFRGQQYDITANQLPIIPVGTASSVLLDKYNAITFDGVNTSVLWRNGYLALGASNYNISSLNILHLLNQYANNLIVDNINSYYGILQFDPVTKDILYPSVLLQKYNGTEFINNNLYIENPLLGSFRATFTNPPPKLSFIPTPSYQPYGKAIALFELSINPNPVDPIYRDSLYYFWYKNNSFPKFPIIDTEGDINKTINLLDTYYNQGYRIFLGFSRSSVLTAVVSWFNAHPLAVGISLWSSAISLKNVSRNIYRTIPSDDAIVNAVLPYLPNKTVGNVFYIYTKDELSPEETLIILESQSDLNIIPYAVDPNIPLTVSDLQTFFDDNNASDKDVVVLELFDDESYFDLYSNGLNFLGNQYDIINSNLPSINGTTGQEKLNDKLFYIKNQYSNTSLLFRENADYLTTRSGGDTYITSAGLSNALSMIDYFQKGKNVGLLGSFSAILQFNTFKDIQYPSFLFRVYKMLPINNFVPNYISFNDPLLGSFEADFV